MSECVVRMERVPKNCDDGCWGALSGECPWCDHIDGYVMAGNRPPNCPIICQLPEGHGDLIDRDVLLQTFQNADYETYNDYCEAFDTTEAAETIVPAERSET